MTVSAPTTVNGTATLLNSAISKAMGAAETIVDNLIVAQIAAWTGPMAPFCAFLVNIFIKPFVSPLVSYIGGKFSVVLQNGGTFAVIDLQVDYEDSNESAALKNYIIALKGGDPNAIQAARIALANAQSSLTHDDGSAPAQ